MARRLLIAQEVQSYRLRAGSLTSSVNINATALAGSFTPEFESVYYGSSPGLGPDPDLVGDLTSLGALINVFVWTAAVVFGADKIARLA